MSKCCVNIRLTWLCVKEEHKVSNKSFWHYLLVTRAKCSFSMAIFWSFQFFTKSSAILNSVAWRQSWKVAIRSSRKGFSLAVEKSVKIGVWGRIYRVSYMVVKNCNLEGWYRVLIMNFKVLYEGGIYALANSSSLGRHTCKNISAMFIDGSRWLNFNNILSTTLYQWCSVKKFSASNMNPAEGSVQVISRS